MPGRKLRSLRSAAGRTLDVLTFCLLLFAVWIFWSRREGAPPPAASIQSPQPATGGAVGALTAVDALQRDTLLFRDGRSDVLLVLLFRSDCAACASQRAGWMDLARLADSARIRALALTPEPLTDPVLQYFAPAYLTVLQVKDPTEMWTSLESRVVPTTIIVGSERQVRFRHDGVMTPAAFHDAEQTLRNGSGSSP